MKIITLLWYFVILCLPIAHSQLGEGTFSGQIDATSLAKGGCLMDLSFTDSTRVSLHYRRPYGLNALNRVGIEATLPYRTMSVNASFAQVGDEVLQEQSVQVHLKKTLSTSIRIKVGCGLYHVQAINETSGNGVYADLRILYLISDAIVAGCRFVNPTGSSTSVNGEKKQLEQFNIIGLNYSPVSSMKLLLEAEKRPGRSPFTRLGLVYTLDKAFTVMGGVSNNPLHITWGLMSRVNRTEFTLGFAMHPRLGVTSALSCIYYFRSKQ